MICAPRTGTGLWRVDFGAEPATTNKINGVVARETHGLVPTLFSAPLPASTRTVLTNTVYLKAHWPQPFRSTSMAPFHTADGHAVQVPLMTNTGPVARYRQVAGWQSATLPYAGGRLAAVGLLPPPHAANCAVPSLAQWTALTDTAPSQPAGVRLPRCTWTRPGPTCKPPWPPWACRSAAITPGWARRTARSPRSCSATR